MNIALVVALSLVAAPARPDTATFAGGCFWTMEHAYEDLPGVISATSGFMGGTTKNPSYIAVVEGNTGHLESVQVVYDPAKISYETLLWTFWHNIDPFQANGQACDHGPQYQSAIFYRDSVQQRLATESKRNAGLRFHREVVTQLRAAGPFFAAEEYHQHYAKKNPMRYGLYRTGCGRDRILQQLWGTDTTHAEGGEAFMNKPKPSDAELRQRLTPLQYEVTQHEVTERPFQNEFWDNHKAGI